jgi:Tfp pilus assembly protein PilF
MGHLNMRIPSRSRALIIATLVLCTAAGCATGSDPVTRAYLEDAAEAIDNDRLEEAKIMAQLAVERNPNMRESRSLLAQVHRDLASRAVAQDEPLQARQHWEKAGEVEPSRQRRAQDYLQALELAIALFEADLEIAKLATLAVEADPTLIAARRHAALHWDNANEKDLAIDHYLWLWSAFPDDLQVGLRLGMLYLGTGRLADANAVFNVVLSRDPHNVQAALNRAVALEEMGLRGEAREVYEAILSHFPDNPSLLLRYAGFLERIGETRRAERLMDRAYEQMPGVERREMRRLR